MDDERDWIKGFIREEERLGLVPRTFGIRQQQLELVLDQLGSFDVGPRRLQQWIEMWPKYRKNSTKEGVRVTLSVFYDWCNDHDHLSGNPAKQFKFDSSGVGSRSTITEGDIRRAVESADAAQRCWITLAAYQGLACRQMAVLTREDVDTGASPNALRLSGKGSKVISPNLHPETLTALEQLPMPSRGHLFAGLDAQDISKAIRACLHGAEIRVSANALVHWYRKQAELFGTDFGRRFDETVIDPDLWEHVRRSFAAGDWAKVTTEAAIFTEDRIRRWAGRPRNELGEQLMTAVFADRGAFRLGATDTERHGWHRLAMGLSMAVRNPAAHHVEQRPDHRAYAAGFLGACSLLLTEFRHEHGDVMC